MASDDTFGYEECISNTRWTMKTVGLWPLDDAVILSTCKLIIGMIAMVFTLIIPQTRKVIKVHDDFNLTLEILTIANIDFYVALLKLITVWYYKIDLRKLLLQIHADWQNTSTEEQRKMWLNARMSKWIVTFILSTTLGTATVYILLFFITFKSNIIYINGTSVRPFFVIADFPFDIHRSPVYEIILLSQCIGAYFGGLAFTSYDCIYVCTILHFSGQLNNLKCRFRKLVLEHQQNKIPFASCLKSVTRRHLHLVRYVDIIEEDFNKTFLVQAFAISVALCLKGYQLAIILSESISEARGILVFIIVFATANLTSIFMYCFIAQILRNESEALFYAVYQMNWYEIPAKDAMSVVLLMNRCMRPIEITVGKFAPFTLEYFTKVLKTSVGYLSVLLAVKDKIMK